MLRPGAILAVGARVASGVGTPFWTTQHGRAAVNKPSVPKPEPVSPCWPGEAGRATQRISGCETQRRQPGDRATPRPASTVCRSQGLDERQRGRGAEHVTKFAGGNRSGDRRRNVVRAPVPGVQRMQHLARGGPKSRSQEIGMTSAYLSLPTVPLTVALLRMRSDLKQQNVKLNCKN